MDRNPPNRQPLKVTSYAEFLQKMKSAKTDRPVQNTPRPQAAKVTAQIQKDKQLKKPKVNAKCNTETSPLNCKISKETLNEHFLSKDSNTQTFNQSQAFISIQNDCDWELPSSHPNKENTFIQPKSCSRMKHNISYDDASYCQAIGPTQSDELASFMLNEILLIVKEITKFNRQRITYLDYLQILRELNMIQNSYEPCKDDIVFKLWETLIAGNKENTTCLINLSIVILAVMNTAVKIKTVKQHFSDVCYSVDGLRSPNTTAKRTQSKNIKEYKKNKEGLFDLSQQDITQINRTFKELRVTRMFLGRIHKKSEMIEEKAERYTSHSFKPYISSKSRSLAKKKRTKDSDNCHYKSVVANQQTSRCQTERELKETQVNIECANQRNLNTSSSQIGIKRSELLYSMAKSKSREKRDRKQDEIELQSNEGSYTFKPAILTYSRNVEKKKQNIAGQSKEVNRLLKARLEKQVLEAASAKGIPYNAKEFNKIRKKINVEINHQTLSKKLSDKNQQEITETKPTKSIEEPVPVPPQSTQPITERKEIFTFEVYLEEDVKLDKITIYEGDNPDTVAQEFVQKHKLKPEMQTKLAKSLHSHLSRLYEADRLGKIQQQSIEQSFEI